MESPDVLIIGGGIVGMVAALELADTGARVAIVDAGTNAGTHANAGSLHVQMQSRFMRMYPDQVANVEASLPVYIAAARDWARLEQALGPFDLVREGGLMLAEGAEQLAFLEAKAAREQARGLDVEILDRTALDRIAPWLGPQIVGAELCRNEGKLNPLAANRRLLAALEARGIPRRTDTVARIDRDGPALLAHGARASYRADRILLAAAWGAGDLARSFGIDMPTAAEPLHMNITEAAAPEIRHLVQHAERSITLKQFPTGQIVIGGGWPATGRGPATPPAVRAASLLGNVSLAARLVPAIGGLRVIRTWAGMNTTIDGASVIGPLPSEPRLHVAVPGDAGYTLGPLVARMAAALLTGDTPPEDPAPFSPARFAR